jgi:membrane protease YdiL (CAAX protease family)
LDDLESMSTGALLANVALSQGLFGIVLLLGAWYAEIPLSAFGVVPADPWNLGPPALAAGLGFGVVLYVGNELLGNVVEDLGIDFSEELREVLAPDTPGGWLVLLAVVLPAIAAFEEFLFRAALVGALAVGFGVSPWALAVLSSVAFAVGHGMQGPGGVVVTGLLGFVLAAAFVLTGSLLVVVVAHYVVNALEFVVHEGLGWEPFRTEGGT